VWQVTFCNVQRHGDGKKYWLIFRYPFDSSKLVWIWHWSEESCTKLDHREERLHTLYEILCACEQLRIREW